LRWDGPTDPRGDLRWSLSKLRPLLDEAGSGGLRADRAQVEYEPGDTVIDLVPIERAAADLAAVATADLGSALAAGRGELLEGLELPDCHRFDQWLVGERERVRGLRTAVLSEVIERLSDEPETALGWA